MKKEQWGEADRQIAAFIGDQIRTVRKSKNLSQAELGNLVGLTQRTISAIETADLDPSLITLNKIADALNTPMSALMPKKKKLTN